MAEPARQRSPRRNRPVASWNGSVARAASYVDASLGSRASEKILWVGLRPTGGPLLVQIRAWCNARRGSVGRAHSRAAARSGTQRAGGGLEAWWTGRTARRATSRTRRTGAGFRRSAPHHGTIVVTCLVGLRTSGGCPAESQCGPEPACERTRTAWPRGDLVLLVILARPRLVRHGHTGAGFPNLFFFRFSKAVGDTQTPHHLNCFCSMCLYQYV